MAETGVENRIMGDLNAYSPEVSGEFPASPFSPKQLDITLVWLKLLRALCSLWSQLATDACAGNEIEDAHAGGNKRGERSCWWQQVRWTVVLATRADACAGNKSGGVLVLATNARAGNNSGGLSC